MKDKYKLLGSLEQLDLKKDDADERKELPDSAFADVKNRKYLIDTREHTRAAWSYINMPKNAAKYTPGQLKVIKARIKKAAKRFGIHIKVDEKLETSVEDMDDGGGDMGEPGDVGDVTDAALLNEDVVDQDSDLLNDAPAQLFFDDDEDDDTPEAADQLLLVMELESELRHEFANIDESYTDVDLINEETQSLEAIRDSITTYGICQATMEAVDPKHKFVEQGLCCSYEELGSVPMKDAVSELVATNINNKIIDKYKTIMDRRTILKERESAFMSKVTEFLEKNHGHSSGEDVITFAEILIRCTERNNQ